jgi:SEC-C motif
MHASMKFPRNSPCPCGSGRKYKHCHLGKPFKGGRDLSLHGRNLILLNAARDIFGLSRGRSWVDVKKNISGEQIRELYSVQADLWPPGTDWAALMPRPGDGTLRALYLGDIRPELVLRNIIRFSLYSDTIFVIDPFVNPHIVRPKYNPIDTPNKHKADTLKLIYFLSAVAPWIESEMLYLIPDPGDLNLDLKWETMRLAQARGRDKNVDERDLEDARTYLLEQRMRALFTLPDEKLLSFVRRSGMTLTVEQQKEFLAHARHKLRSDPIALEQSLDKEGQLIPLYGVASISKPPC